MKKKTLPRLDQSALEAAEGWLLLRNPREANEELGNISPENQYHPLVLASRWQVYAASKWWEAALAVSRALCAIAPNQAESWICQANALRRNQGALHARQLLLSVVKRFPDDPVIPYNLACFSCQLGRVNDSCHWLLRALQIENSVELKLLALADPDLKPLWDRLAPLPLPAAAAASTSSSSSAA